MQKEVKPKYTGERNIPALSSREDLADNVILHSARYNFAAQQVIGKRVLDAGCGTGYGAKLLAQKGAKHVVAIDVSSEAIDYANQEYRHENLSFKKMDCQKLDFANSSFDLICSIETIEHLENPEEFIREAKRILKPKGILILSTPNRAKSAGHCSKWLNPYHKHEFYYQELNVLLKKHFSNVEIFTEKINNPEYNSYYQRVDQFRRRYIGLALRKLVPSSVRTLVRRRLFGNMPSLKLEDIHYSSKSAEDSLNFVVKCIK